MISVGKMVATFLKEPSQSILYIQYGKKPGFIFVHIICNDLKSSITLFVSLMIK